MCGDPTSRVFVTRRRPGMDHWERSSMLTCLISCSIEVILWVSWGPCQSYLFLDLGNVLVCHRVAFGNTVRLRNIRNTWKTISRTWAPTEELFEIDQVYVFFVLGSEGNSGSRALYIRDNCVTLDINLACIMSKLGGSMGYMDMAWGQYGICWMQFPHPPATFGIPHDLHYLARFLRMFATFTEFPRDHT